MGFVFSTDFLLWRKSGNIDTAVGIPAFITVTAGKRWKLPARQYGRLRRESDGTFCFVWRSWLVGPEHKIDLGKPSDFHGGSTLLYPVVLEGIGENVLFRLPPRYRRNAQEVSILLGLRDCHDTSIIRNTWKALKQLFNTGITA